MRTETVTNERDERIAIAERNWAPRFIVNGVDFSDFRDTLGRMQVWEDWLPAWSRTAEYYEGLARGAELRGNALSASEAWRRAALCWHFGKFLFFEDADAATKAQERMTECYSKGLWSLEPPGERVLVPYKGVMMGGILRRPAGADRPPLVIMWPGLDSTKEELQTIADVFLRRGLATLAVDGPGQGETERTIPIEAASEGAVGAAIDFALRWTDLDTKRLALFGVSLGGYYSVRAAAYEPRIRAAVDLAGPYNLGALFDRLPPMTRAAIQHRTGAADANDARSRAGALDLQGVAAKVSCPLAVVHGTDDPLVPFADGERIAREAPNARLFRFDGGNHGMSNRAFEMRSTVGDWLADQLNA